MITDAVDAWALEKGDVIYDFSPTDSDNTETKVPLVITCDPWEHGDYIMVNVREDDGTESELSYAPFDVVAVILSDDDDCCDVARKTDYLEHDESCEYA